jgi:HK97 family phage prohead protease
MTDRPWLAGTYGRDVYAAAAEERSGRASRERSCYRSRSDRPSQRRSAEDGQGPARAPARVRDMSLRESGDGGLLIYEGFASVTDTSYEMWDFFGPYDEQVISGAFGETLAQPDLDVPLVLQHADLRRIARTTNDSLELSEEVPGGLHVLAPRLDPEDRDVAYIVPKLRSGLIDEMSFKFMITKGSWSPDWMEYHIEAVDLHRGDVAIVGYGANPHTAGAGLRSRNLPAPTELARDLTDDAAHELVGLLRTRLAPATAARTLISDDDVRQRTLSW